PRQARHAAERKIARNAASLFPSRPLGPGLFLFQVAVVFHRCFDAGEIDRAGVLRNRQSDLLLLEKAFEPNRRLLQQACRVDARAAVVADVRTLHEIETRFGPAAPRRFEGWRSSRSVSYLRRLASNRAHRSSVIRPAERPIGVRRKSALSTRSSSRCSARAVNIRYGSAAPPGTRWAHRMPV